MTDTSLIKILDTLQVVACPDCGETFAISEGLLLAARDHAREIHCPMGHAWTPLPANADPRSNLPQALIETRAKLADALVKLAAVRTRVLELTPGDDAPLSKAELRRRSQIVANRADAGKDADTPAGNFGRAVCQFCGRTKSRGNLAEHIRRVHGDALAEKPAEYFSAAADKVLNLNSQRG